MAITKTWIALLVVALASAACAAEDCASATKNLTEAVPFFSERGQKLRDLCAIPSPPIVEQALAAAEPPRTKRAEDWSSPFCRTWADAKFVCARTLGGGKPECLPRPNAETMHVDKIVCVNADVEALKHGCAELNMTKDVHYADGSVDSFDFEGNPSWSFSLAAHTWDMTVDGDNRLVPAHKGPPRQLAYSMEDSVCRKTLTGASGDPVVIEK